MGSVRFAAGGRGVRSTLARIAESHGLLRWLGVAWFVTNFAEWAYVTALSIDGFREYGALVVGLIGARFVFGAVLGPLLVERLAARSPALSLPLQQIARCLVVAAAAVAVTADAPVVVWIALVWIDAAIAAAYRPLQSMLLPALIRSPNELSAIAGTIPASKALAQATGALAGSVALAAISPAAVLEVAALLFGLSAALVAPLRKLRTVRATASAVDPDGDGDRDRSGGGNGTVSGEGSGDGDGRGGGGAGADRSRRLGATRAGFELLVRKARPLLLLGGTRSITRGLWTSLVVVASIQLLHMGSSGVGELMAAAGAGAAAAVPLSLLLAGRAHLADWGALAFALSGIPILLVGVLAMPAPAVALIGVWGLAFALADSISNSLLHRVVESRLLAPSVAALESSKLMLEGLGALVAPALLSVFGVRGALLVAGALLPALVVLSRPGLRRVDRRAATRTRPVAALRAAPSLRGLTMLSLESLAARLRSDRVDAGEVIVRAGETGDRFYLIDAGRVEISMDGFPIGVLGPFGSFGEKALLRSAPRGATVAAIEPTALWSLSGADFVAAATGEETPGLQQLASGPRSLLDALADVPLFAGIDRRAAGSRGAHDTRRAGETIVREGDPGDTFYVLLSGEAGVSIKGESVKALHPGDWFGEIALLHRVARTATVTARTDVTLWTLDRESFLGLIAPAEQRQVGAPDLPPDGAGVLV